MVTLFRKLVVFAQRLRAVFFWFLFGFVGRLFARFWDLVFLIRLCARVYVAVVALRLHDLMQGFLRFVC